jgi:hypothetical protein
MMDLRGAFGDGAKHDAPVGDGFVAGNGDLSSESTAFAEFHVVVLLVLLGLY